MQFDRLKTARVHHASRRRGVAWPLAARAQQPAMPVIGFLSSGSADAFAHRVRAFHQGLKEAGYVEGENVMVLYRWAEGQNDRLVAQAADLVRRHVAVISTFGSLATLTVKKATSTIPIVFALDEDPVRLGLVASLSRPGGNLTGTNFFANEVVAKRLELLRELVPAAKRLAVLVNPTYPATETTLRDAAPAARAMGLQIDVLNASTSGEINAAFATLMRERPDGLFVAGDPFFYHPAHPTGQFGVAPRHPGDLQLTRVSRGRRVDELWHQHCGFVAPGRRLRGPILKGAKPADLPVCRRASSSWSSTPRPPRCSGSKFRPRCSRAPTR